jgi:hypothetical protein
MYFRSNVACANAISKINKQIKNMTQIDIEYDKTESSLQNEVDETSSVWSKHTDLMVKKNNSIIFVALSVTTALSFDVGIFQLLHTDRSTSPKYSPVCC